MLICGRVNYPRERFHAQIRDKLESKVSLSTARDVSKYHSNLLSDVRVATGYKIEELDYPPFSCFPQAGVLLSPATPLLHLVVLFPVFIVFLHIPHFLVNIIEIILRIKALDSQ